MNARVLPPQFLNVDLPLKDSTASDETTPVSLFTSIPPERIGLNGEYDHSGLAKRVLQAFYAQVDDRHLAGLRVLQRGKVVLLMGTVPSRSLLTQLVQIARQVEGAADVEINGIRGYAAGR